MCIERDSENTLKERAADGGTQPKVEVVDCGSPNESSLPRKTEDDGASSFGSDVRSSLISMGFKSSLVDRAIEENGESNIEVLLEAVLSYSPLCRPDSSDYLDSLFGDDDGAINLVNYSTSVNMKQVDDVCAGVGEEKRAVLRKMSFSSNEIEFAINKLGEDVLINEMVDFIFAARIAKTCERDSDAPMQSDKESIKDCNPESLLGTMEKMLRLIEMGFSENEILAAINRLGPEVSVQVLADTIISHQNSGGNHAQKLPSEVNAEGSSSSNNGDENLELSEKLKGKRPVEEPSDELSTLKRPKQEYETSIFPGDPAWREARNFGQTSSVGYGVLASRRQVQRTSVPMSTKSLNSKVFEPPYFFYGNVTGMSEESWTMVRMFLYDIQPEYVNSRFFSCLDRKEGYVHNLPTQNRFHLEPKPPMSIEEALPYTKKWWPSWDTRKQLSCINCEASEASQVCERLRRMLEETEGVLSSQQETEIFHQCEVFNLMWVGKHKLAVTEPEFVERLLGYPHAHTRDVGFKNLSERFKSLKNSFQIHTLAYQLSVLKALYPEGMTVLSIHSGIGGAEIALDKLGIHLKAVVSIEPSEIKRKVLQQWWRNTGQTGELLQLQGIRMLSIFRVDSLLSKFGKFDLIICQDPPAGSSKKCKATPDEKFYFSSFCELVRIIQRVRNA